MEPSCFYCDKEVRDPTYVTTGDGIAHIRCELLYRPFRPKASFVEVIWNIHDQTIVKELLERHVPAKVKKLITEKFNTAMALEWAKRVTESPKPNT
jgi:hypothetical protein